MDITKTATDTVKKPFMLARAYPLAVAIIALIAMAIGVRKGAQWQTDIKASAAGGSTIGKALAWVFGVTLAVAFLVPLDAVAAVAHQASASVDGGAFGSIAKLIGGALALGTVAAYTRPSMIPHQFSSGNFRESLPLTGVDGERNAILTYTSDRVGDKPLKATEVGFLVRFTDTQTDNALPIGFQQFGRVIAFVEIDSPVLGLVADRKICTGPNLWNNIIPALRQGKRGLHSDAMPGHEGEGSTITKGAFYLPVPFTDDSSERPIDTARLFRELTGSTVRVQPGAATAFGAGHTISDVSVELVTNAVVDRGEKPWQIGAILVFNRYMRKAAAGQSEIQFDNVGGSGGPSGSNCTKGSRMVFASIPTSQFGQSGPITGFEGLQRYGCPMIGQPDTVLTETLALQTVAAMDLNNGNDAEAISGSNWPIEITFNGEDLDEQILPRLSVFPVITMGARRKASQMQTMNDNLTVNVQFETAPESGQWYLYTIERRDLHANVVEALAKELGFDPNKAKRATIDGNDPTGKILSDASGTARAHHRALPVQLQ